MNGDLYVHRLRRVMYLECEDSSDFIAITPQGEIRKCGRGINVTALQEMGWTVQGNLKDSFKAFSEAVVGEGLWDVVS